MSSSDDDSQERFALGFLFALIALVISVVVGTVVVKRLGAKAPAQPAAVVVDAAPAAPVAVEEDVASWRPLWITRPSARTRCTLGVMALTRLMPSSAVV